MVLVGGICLAVGAVAGFVGGYFVLRNNPEAFDVDDILKGKADGCLDTLKQAAEDRLDDLKERI